MEERREGRSCGGRGAGGVAGGNEDDRFGRRFWSFSRTVGRRGAAATGGGGGRDGDGEERGESFVSFFFFGFLCVRGPPPPPPRWIGFLAAAETTLVVDFNRLLMVLRSTRVGFDGR